MSIFDTSFSRRRFSLAATSMLGLALTGQRSRAADLSAVTLRVASFRGMDSTLLPALGLNDFPIR